MLGGDVEGLAARAGYDVAAGEMTAPGINVKPEVFLHTRAVFGGRHIQIEREGVGRLAAGRIIFGERIEEPVVKGFFARLRFLAV